MSGANISKESREVYQIMSAMGKLAIQRKKATGEQMHKPRFGYIRSRDHGVVQFSVENMSVRLPSTLSDPETRCEPESYCFSDQRMAQVMGVV